MGLIIWGGVSYRGLVPSDSPIFVDELCDEYEPKPKTVNSHMYVDIILKKVDSAVLGLYPEGDAIYQDDGATIH